MLEIGTRKRPKWKITPEIVMKMTAHIAARNLAIVFEHMSDGGRGYIQALTGIGLFPSIHIWKFGTLSAHESRMPSQLRTHHAQSSLVSL